MDTLLLAFLERLERVAMEHEGLFDSEVRQRLRNAIMGGFVSPNVDYVVPEEFGMYSEHANQMVRSALSEFICNANGQAQALGILTFHGRLQAFQNPSVRTPVEKNDYEEFFGHTESENFDRSGNLLQAGG
ncbi:MAG: hypothetical protein K2X38_20620 [Gemmataceae bacterium]|nr:hypothetical protein [Gemmataceae bacterium]